MIDITNIINLAINVNNIVIIMSFILLIKLTSVRLIALFIVLISTVLSMLLVSIMIFVSLINTITEIIFMLDIVTISGNIDIHISNITLTDKQKHSGVR